MKERFFVFTSHYVQREILEKLEIFSVKCAFFKRSQHSSKITELENKQKTGKKVQIRIIFSHCLSFHFLKLLLLVHRTTLYVTYPWLKNKQDISDFKSSQRFKVVKASRY